MSEIDPITYLNTLKNELNNGSTLVDYFIEIGIKPEIFRESFLYESSLNDLNTKYKDKICPTIISMFPTFEKAFINIDNSVINHVFPHGFKIINIQPAPVVFSIVLDNSCLSSKFPHKYLACLLFYESILEYKTLYDIYSKWQNNNASFKNSISNSSITKREEYASYFIPKCICFASVYPFIDLYSELLLKLHSFSSQSKNIRNKTSIEKLIENIVIEIPVPPRGFHDITFNLFEEKVYEINQSLMNELPSAHFELERIFDQFKVETIIEIVKYLLLEEKIIFYSEDIRNLTPVILGFLSFIYPLKYPYLVISILPEKQFEYIESTSPNIYGVNEKYTFNYFESHNTNLAEMPMVIVDIDQGSFEVMPTTLPSSSRISQRKKSITEDYPDFPKGIKSKLEKKLTKYIGNIRSQRIKKERNIYLERFFSFMVSLLSTYSKYIIQDFQVPVIMNGDISVIFNAKEYYMSYTGTERIFYKKLTETKMFYNFIFQRLFPKNSTETLETIFFDEKINEISSKHIFSKTKANLFIESKEYQKIQQHQVSRHKKLSIKDVEYYSKTENRHKALLNAQYCELLNNEEIIFTYYIFPSLLSDDLFQHNISEYYIPVLFYKNVEKKNDEIITKINKSINNNHITEMENYIYLSWVNMWALTFWYHSQEEREFRFNQLLDVLDRIWSHEIDLFSLLFDVLRQNEENKMIIVLYSRLIKYRLSPTPKIYSLIIRLIDKDKLPLMIQKVDKSKNLNDTPIGYDTDSFKKRTLKDKTETNILSEELYFYAYEKCIDCFKEFDVYDKSKDFKNIQQEEMWTNCPGCQKTILPVLNFRFGIEVYNQDVTQASSSYSGSILLNSPKYLRENIKRISMNEADNHFNVDSFKARYKTVFWNLVWYLQIMNLDISFMLPYLPIKIGNETINSNSFKLSICNNISLIPTESQIEGMNSLSKDPIKMFVIEELIMQKVYNFDIIPNIGMVPVMGITYHNVCVSGYALNTTDIELNNYIIDNLFSENSLLIEDNENLNEEKKPEHKNKLTHRLQPIKEDQEKYLANEEEDNLNDYNDSYFNTLRLDSENNEENENEFCYSNEDSNPLYIIFINTF